MYFWGFFDLTSSVLRVLVSACVSFGQYNICFVIALFIVFVDDVSPCVALQSVKRFSRDQQLNFGEIIELTSSALRVFVPAFSLVDKECNVSNCMLVWFC